MPSRSAALPRRSPTTSFSKQAQAAQAKEAVETHQAGVQRVADKEDALRLEDQEGRIHSARPDLRTAELKRKAENEKDITAEHPADDDVVMDSDNETRAVGGFNEMDEDSDAYKPGEDAPSDEADDDADYEAALAEFKKKHAAARKKQATKAAKPPKGALRTEIQAAARVAIPASNEKTLKRKPSAQTGDSQQKIPKATIGGLKRGWQKAVGALPKPSKTAIRGRASSVSSGVSSMTLPSSRATSASSARNSISEAPSGEFDNEESPESLQAARGSKTASAMVNATAKMGISLIPKDVVLRVDGKVQREPKVKFTNAHLPFPQGSFTVDLKFWQTTLIPELIDWVATHDDVFAANSHQQFEVVVKNLWTQYFSAYPYTEAVKAMAAAAVRNWRRKIGKTTVKAVESILKEYDTIEERAQAVQEALADCHFVYEDQDAERGAYRSELILRGFAAHQEMVLKTDVSYGHPVGAMAAVCAAGERALTMHKTGQCSTDGVKRKGKRSAHSFIAVPWAARAQAYLPGIKALTTKKWSKIMAMSRPFIESAAQIRSDDTEGDDYEDARGQIQVSDDSDDEVAPSPQTLIVRRLDGGHSSRPKCCLNVAKCGLT
ncbi:hypothetical protein FB451DRAFT_1176775 [Mycena latifolia]|nr:hypothetical protein FB451DRAFT_1176775 [Mycena latifolia]